MTILANARPERLKAGGSFSRLATLLVGFAATKLVGVKRGTTGPARGLGQPAAPAQRPHERRNRGSSRERPHAGPEVARKELTRGRDAETPSEIPAKGWKDVLWRVYGQLSEDRILAVAAGVTFYALLAIFPGIAAFVSLYGLVSD